MRRFLLGRSNLKLQTYGRGILFLWTLFLSIAAGKFDIAVAEPPDIAMSDQTEAWQIEADRVDYDKINGRMVATGNVTIRKAKKEMTADRVVFDNQDRVVNAYGHVVFTSGSDLLTGQRIEFDLDSETGTVYKGTVFMSEGHFYIKGDSIRKIGKNSYDAANASLSTCDAEKPDWHIEGREVQVTIDGYGRVKHASLWAGGIPLLYTPYFSFPAKVRRQSGFLSPYPAVSSRKGIEYIQPFYWAINQNTDATFFYHHMQYRGEKLGLEYRYLFCPKIKGMVMFDGYNDRKVDRYTASDDEWGYEDEGEQLIRPNAERYWIRAKQDIALPFQVDAKLDVDVVSDQDYLHEFKNGYTGFEYSDEAFLDFFGRDLDDYDDTTRINRFNLNKTTNAFSINTEIRWYDNVISRLPGETDTSRHKLPYVGIESARQNIYNLPLYYTIDAEYAQFYGRDITKGQRTDLYSRVYLPLGWSDLFSFEPSYGFRQTYWVVKDYDETGPSYTHRNLNRHMYDVGMDFFTELYRVYDYQGETVDRVKHAIRPEISYQYIPDKDQTELPGFDPLDNIDKQNIVTYSLINTWTLRAKPPARKGSEKETGGPQAGYRYSKFCRLKFEQSFDFNKEREDDPEPFSDIAMELDIFPLNYVWIDADAAWNQYEEYFTSHNVGLGLTDGGDNQFKVEHRFVRNTSRSIYTRLDLAVVRFLKTYIEYERNIEESTDILLATGLSYHRQCWEAGLHYRKDENDWKTYATITLTGISGFTTPSVHFD